MAEIVDDALPSSQRLVPGSVNIPIAKWPETTDIKDASGDPSVVSSKMMDSFNKALEQKDYGSLAGLFLEDGYWRDQLGLTWDFRTAKGRDAIQSLLRQGHHLVKVDIDNSPNHGPQMTPMRYDGSVTGILFYTLVTTKVGSGRGTVRLVQDSGEWKIWTLTTAMFELKGHESAIGPRRPIGVQHGAEAGRKNWLDRRHDEADFKNSQPDVLIIGSGQAGLSVNARLKILGVPTLTIDRCDDIGDAWRNRYHQLVLHDPVWYDHMPYIKFPEFWPVFSPKDKMANFLRSYAEMLELNIWTKTELESTSWDDGKKQWTVILKRRLADGTTETRMLYPKHIIQATGHSGQKNLPTFKGQESFKGDVFCHSSDFRTAKKDGNGRKAVVIGSCNSAMDIAQDYYENGYDVTMIQRSSTCIMSVKSVLELTLSPLYCEGGPATEDADLLSMGAPQEFNKALHVDANMLQQGVDKETLEGLNKVGFKTDRGPSDSGLLFKYLQRNGGYYIDVGTGRLIIEGKVKVKHGYGVEEILPDGLRLQDGTVLEADEIVCATGYQNMLTATEKIFGKDVADKVGGIWGFDEEGETRVMWRRSGHPGLWFHGGNLAMCRYFSTLVAVQIKGQLEGLASS
ncbi:hypothetical protein F5Y17DRAFT_465373 [Xylariaceae sp. FL0594]|nr:hypothetical protein F5Y17DRAFT_465373 [Xylariaceae sp. FL0594]